MSEWDPSPAPTAQNFPAAPTSAAGAAASAIAELGRQAREAASGLFAQAGIRIERALMTISRGLRVEGDLESTGSATFGGDLASTGSATFGGDLTTTGLARLLADLEVGGDGVVTGLLQSNNFVPGVSGWRLTPTGLEVNTLTAKDAIIGNAALANPVTGNAAGTATASAWGVGTAMATKATATITVPAGFSRAVVFATASMHFQDSAPNGGWVRAVIAGNAGAEMGGLANLNLGQTAIHTVELTGLSGGTISLEVQVRASVASSATTGRIAQIGGYALFFRS